MVTSLTLGCLFKATGCAPSFKEELLLVLPWVLPVRVVVAPGF
jgi:hypothetical protein